VAKESERGFHDETLPSPAQRPLVEDSSANPSEIHLFLIVLALALPACSGILFVPPAWSELREHSRPLGEDRNTARGCMQYRRDLSDVHAVGRNPYGCTATTFGASSAGCEHPRKLINSRNRLRALDCNVSEALDLRVLIMAGIPAGEHQQVPEFRFMIAKTALVLIP
jgi:hypothetical protein